MHLLMERLWGNIWVTVLFVILPVPRNLVIIGQLTFREPLGIDMMHQLKARSRMAMQGSRVKGRSLGTPTQIGMMAGVFKSIGRGVVRDDVVKLLETWFPNGHHARGEG